jgi:23S rRNA-/tRNA-specific pseudouridylate synthase
LPRTLLKPAGIPVFPPHLDPEGDCVLRRLVLEDPARAAPEWPAGFEGGIAHRLDISTSGALLVAEDVAELAWLRELFTAKRLVKTYRLLTGKEVPWDANRCDYALAHDRKKRSRMVVQRGRNTPHRGKWLEASTAFERIRGPLFQAQMSTGVMHQIRVHAAFLGIPLLGDKRYGGGPTPDAAPSGRQFFLHHVGMGCDEIATAPVPLPPWAESGSLGE